MKPHVADWQTRVYCARVVPAGDAEITIDIDQLGDGTAKGLKVTLIGYQP